MVLRLKESKTIDTIITINEMAIRKSELKEEEKSLGAYIGRAM